MIDLRAQFYFGQTRALMGEIDWVSCSLFENSIVVQAFSLGLG